MYFPSKAISLLLSLSLYGSNWSHLTVMMLRNPFMPAKSYSAAAVKWAHGSCRFKEGLFCLSVIFCNVLLFVHSTWRKPPWLTWIVCINMQNELQFGIDPILQSWHLKWLIPPGLFVWVSQKLSVLKKMRRFDNRWETAPWYPFPDNEGFVYVNLSYSVRHHCCCSAKPPSQLNLSLRVLG